MRYLLLAPLFGGGRLSAKQERPGPDSGPAFLFAPLPVVRPCARGLPVRSRKAAPITKDRRPQLELGRPPVRYLPDRTGQGTASELASPFPLPPAGHGHSSSLRTHNDDSSNTLRSVLSLFIFVHFFCVLVVLSSTFRRSALQAKLVTIFGPYAELLDFDPGPYTPYFYTLGRDEDNDAFIAIDLYAQGDEPVAAQPLLKTVTLPDEGSPGWATAAAT